MKFENTTVTGIENAIIGLRLPMSKVLRTLKVSRILYSFPAQYRK